MALITYVVIYLNNTRDYR